MIESRQQPPTIDLIPIDYPDDTSEIMNPDNAPCVGEAVVAVTEIEISQHAPGVGETVVATAEINLPIDLAAVGDALDPIG